MFYKMQADNNNLRKNITTNQKWIPKKMDLKFHKTAFYMYLFIKFVPFWS